MIYLLHFDTPLGSEKHQAQHYLGFVEGDEQSVQSRLQEHRQGCGAKITAAANRAGITYEVVRIFPGDRARERQMKNWNKISPYCPICKNAAK